MIRDAFVRPVAQATPARLTIASGTQIDDCWRRLSAPNKTGASRRESRTVASHATLRDFPDTADLSGAKYYRVWIPPYWSPRIDGPVGAPGTHPGLIPRLTFQP